MNRPSPYNPPVLPKPSSRRLATALVPRLPGITLEQFVVEEHREPNDSNTVRPTLRATSPSAECPDCHQPAGRVHSRYTRVLCDLPWGGFVVRAVLHVRKFFCTVADCTRRIFTERLPALVMPYARRTTRLGDILCLLSLAVGGRAGSRLAKRLQMKASFSTMLRLIRQIPDQHHPTPRVLGVDDWAMHKGQTYGTILCDLERHKVIDLLPDRSPETLAKWLQHHPGVEVVTRDRGGAYADGAAQGAPQAVQVADRWHLLKNMGDILKEVLAREYPQVRKVLIGATRITRQLPRTDEALAEDPKQTAPSPAPSGPAPPGSEGRRGYRSRRSEQRRERRIAKFEEARALRKQGLSYRAIAARVGLDKKTVRKFVLAPAFPEYAYRRGTVRPCQLDPYKAYIVECWQRGCHNSAQIWREMVEQGYKGGRTSVKDFAKELRLQHQHFDRQDNRDRCDDNQSALCPDSHNAAHQASPGSGLSDLSNVPTANKLRWLMVRPPDDLTTIERAIVLQVCHASRDATIAYGMVLDFNAIVRDQQREHFNSWISIALSSGAPELERFARGLQKDYRAVASALELPWSNGQVEGQVNRLKLRKRQLYGRAKFDLLRKYVLEKV